MALEIKTSESDPLFIDLLWDGDLLHRVLKRLFIKELRSLFNLSSREKCEVQFRIIEEKLAKREVVAMLARRGYLSYELRQRLEQKGFSAAAIELALAFGQKGGFIDDEQELDRLVRKEQRKGRGPQAVLFALKQKRVGPEQLKPRHAEMIKQEKKFLEEVIRKRYAHCDFSDSKVRQKIIAQLFRKGFSSDAIFSVINADEDWH